MTQVFQVFNRTRYVTSDLQRIAVRTLEKLNELGQIADAHPLIVEVVDWGGGSLHRGLWAVGRRAPDEFNNFGVGLGSPTALLKTLDPLERMAGLHQGRERVPAWGVAQFCSHLVTGILSRRGKVEAYETQDYSYSPILTEANQAASNLPIYICRRGERQ